MNRKLAHSLIALSTSALVMVALAFAGDPLPATHDPGDALASTTGTDAAPDARQVKIARRGLAMPYFSFARGVRRIGG